VILPVRTFYLIEIGFITIMIRYVITQITGYAYFNSSLQRKFYYYSILDLVVCVDIKKRERLFMGKTLLSK